MYVIFYDVPGYEDSWSVDWKSEEGFWKRYYKEIYRNEWEPQKSLDDYAYNAILERFGLSAQEFPLEKIITMSPKELTKIGTRNPKSYTLGDNRKASEVD